MELIYSIAHLDGATLFALLLGAALAGALLGIVPAWRAIWGAGDLPVRRFLSRQGSTLARRETLKTELQCGLCAAKPLCRRLLATGAKTPPAGCPNKRLFGN